MTSHPLFMTSHHWSYHITSTPYDFTPLNISHYIHCTHDITHPIYDITHMAIRTLYLPSVPLYLTLHPLYLCHQTQGISYTTPTLCMTSHTICETSYSVCMHPYPEDPEKGSLTITNFLEIPPVFQPNISGKNASNLQDYNGAEWGFDLPCCISPHRSW